MTQENFKEKSSKDSTANQCGGDNFVNCEEVVKELDKVDTSNQSVHEKKSGIKLYKDIIKLYIF